MDDRGAAQSNTTATDPATCPVCGKPVQPSTNHGGPPRIYDTDRCRWLAGTRKRAGIPLDQPMGRTRRASRRQPLPEFALQAGITLVKAADRIERVMEDERLDRNLEAVTLALRANLAHAITTAADALSQLDHHQEDDSP